MAKRKTTTRRRPSQTRELVERIGELVQRVDWMMGRPQSHGKALTPDDPAIGTGVVSAPSRDQQVADAFSAFGTRLKVLEDRFQAVEDRQLNKEANEDLLRRLREGNGVTLPNI